MKKYALLEVHLFTFYILMPYLITEIMTVLMKALTLILINSCISQQSNRIFQGTYLLIMVRTGSTFTNF